MLLLCALGTTQASAKAGGPEMFYSVDRSGLYQTDGTLDLWQQDPVLGRPFWRLPDWFEADDLRTHVGELFPDGLSLHGWQYMVERHDFIRPTNSDALFVNHNMVVELVFEYVRRAVFPSRRSRFQSFFAWESLEMARAFRKEGQALYRVESSYIFRADQSWLTLGVQNAIASLSAHRYWSSAPSGTSNAGNVKLAASGATRKSIHSFRAYRFRRAVGSIHSTCLSAVITDRAMESVV